MEDKSLQHRRRNGIYYTPSDLAEFLVEPFVDSGYRTFFDPAYGEGALLLAAEKIFLKDKTELKTFNLYGCDTHPVNGLLTHLPQANLTEGNFFEMDVIDKYDAVLTNPPYIKHQEQDKDQIKKYKNKYDGLRNLSNSSDLWAYFILKAELHLNQGGGIAAVLPWSVLQADYALDFRKHLLTVFESIKVLALNKPYFDDAQERVVLLWLNNFGMVNKKISIGFAKDIEEEIVYVPLESKDWVSTKVQITGKNRFNKIFSTLRAKYGFKKFSNYADVRIGVVTGANDFFVRKLEDAIELGFVGSNLEPILTTTKELPDYLENGSKNLKRLLIITEKNAKKHAALIKSGEKAELERRSHCTSRKPWYHVRSKKIPDAFFPYRIASIPYLVFNTEKVQSTNSIHMVYFKETNDVQKKWIHVSMLSLYCQLSLEFHSKTYGRGLLKLEPGGLNQCLVLPSKDVKVEKIYTSIVEELRIGNKSNAVKIATSFVNEHLDISEGFYKIALEQYEQLQSSKKR